MNDQLLERIRQLERSVRRWRLACLALVIVVVSLLAIGGTFGLMAILQMPNIREMEMVHMELEELRAHERAARAQAEQAVQAERAARQEAERALQAERAAR
jgi:hypothetical protein